MAKSKVGNRLGVGRHTSPSPLLLSPRDMERAILKERMRCDRHQQYFALVVVQLNKSADIGLARQTRIIARLLHKRLRLTDEKGLLLKGGLGVLLPMTDLIGARVILDWLLVTAEQHGISIEADVFSYSGRHNFQKSIDNRDSSEVAESDSDVISVHELADESASGENVGQNASNHALATEKVLQLVRADDLSQVRWRATNQLATSNTISTPHFFHAYPKWKRCSDVAGAVVGLTIAFPVIVVAGVAIKLTSKGPVLFRQMRTGQFGQAFPIYKLRTMVDDAEQQKAKLHELNERDGPAFKMQNDPRVTRVGKILRKTGLDELPQLWNVLVGHMAIVGPRPLPCNEDVRCEPWHRRRLDTKPGLTCIWQTSKSRKVSFDDWMRMDLRYSGKQSVGSDVRLIVKTVLAVVLGRVGH